MCASIHIGRLRRAGGRAGRGPDTHGADLGAPRATLRLRATRHPVLGRYQGTLPPLCDDPGRHLRHGDSLRQPRHTTEACQQGWFGLFVNLVFYDLATAKFKSGRVVTSVCTHHVERYGAAWIQDSLLSE